MNRRTLLGLGLGLGVAAITGVSILKDTMSTSPTITPTGKIVVYGEHWCPYCQSVMDTLEFNNVPYEFRASSDNEDFFNENNFVYIPQVFDKEGRYVGSFEEIMIQLDDAGYDLIFPPEKDKNE